MKKTAQRALELLGEEKESLTQVEQLTERMLYAGAEELPQLMESRTAALQRARELRVAALEACAGFEELRAAVALADTRRGEGEEASRLRRASFAVRAVWNRIQLNDSAVREHLALEKQSIQEKIEALNADAGAQVAGRYSMGVRTALPGNSPRPREKKYV